MFSSISLLGTLGPGDRRLCMRLALHDDVDLSLLHLKRASIFEQQGTGDFMRSECMKLVPACVIHTNLHTLSAACAVLSSYINVCTGYMCFVKFVCFVVVFFWGGGGEASPLRDPSLDKTLTSGCLCGIYIVPTALLATQFLCTLWRLRQWCPASIFGLLTSPF